MVIVKSLAAFLNAKGGTLLIGVDDDGSVCGVERDYATLGQRPDRDGYQQSLVNLVSSTLGKNACANLAISVHLIRKRKKRQRSSS